MSGIVHTVRARLDERRTRREIERAIAGQSSTAMRDELLIAAQRHLSPLGR